MPKYLGRIFPFSQSCVLRVTDSRPLCSSVPSVVRSRHHDYHGGHREHGGASSGATLASPTLAEPGSVRQRRGRVSSSYCSPQSRRACAAAFSQSCVLRVTDSRPLCSSVRSVIRSRHHDYHGGHREHGGASSGATVASPILAEPGSVRQRRGRVSSSYCSPQSRRACAATVGGDSIPHQNLKSSSPPSWPRRPSGACSSSG